MVIFLCSSLRCSVWRSETPWATTAVKIVYTLQFSDTVRTGYAGYEMPIRIEAVLFGEATETPERRIVLSGRTGVGKSASGNTILNEDVFHVERNFSSVTTECKVQCSVIENRRVKVVDTPDCFYATGGDVSAEIKRSVDLSAPGIHAFLLVLSPETFTEQEEDFVSLFVHAYGEEAMRHSIVIFTHGDELRNMKIETLIDQSPALLNLVNECRGRYHVLNNKDQGNRGQVTELLQKIERLVSDNGNQCYTSQVLQDAENRVKAQMERIIEEQKREEEAAISKHQRDLERVRRVTEERVRREIEMESKEGQVNASKNEKFREENKGILNLKRRALLVVTQAKQKPSYAIGALAFVAVVLYVHNKGSVEMKIILRLCLAGVVGAVSERAFLSCFRGQSTSETAEPRRKTVGQLKKLVMLGFVSGAMASCLTGPVYFKTTVLAGFSGAVGAYCMAKMRL